MGRASARRLDQRPNLLPRRRNHLHRSPCILLNSLLGLLMEREVDRHPRNRSCDRCCRTSPRTHRSIGWRPPLSAATYNQFNISRVRDRAACLKSYDTISVNFALRPHGTREDPAHSIAIALASTGSSGKDSALSAPDIAANFLDFRRRQSVHVGRRLGRHEPGSA